MRQKPITQIKRIIIKKNQFQKLPGILSRTRNLLNITNPRTGSNVSGYNLLLHLHKFANGEYDCLARELVCKEPLSLPEI